VPGETKTWKRWIVRNEWPATETKRVWNSCNQRVYLKIKFIPHRKCNESSLQRPICSCCCGNTATYHITMDKTREFFLTLKQVAYLVTTVLQGLMALTDNKWLPKLELLYKLGEYTKKW
jgi:hypothetical protein